MILLISLLFLIPFPFLYFFFPFIPLSFLSTVFYILSYFSYTLSCCAQTDPTIFVISYYHFDCKHCIMPSYCAVLYLAIINFIGSSFKSLCNSALLCHCRSFINLSFVVTFLV